MSAGEAAPWLDPDVRGAEEAAGDARLERPGDGSLYAVSEGAGTRSPLPLRPDLHSLDGYFL